MTAIDEMLEPVGGHPSKLEWLAWWLDQTDPLLEELAGERVGRGAQADLRRWAGELRERVARTEPNPAETQPRAEDRSVLAEINRSLRSQLEEAERQLEEAQATQREWAAQAGRLQEQLEATEQRLAREISEHADRQQALRQLQFLAVNGQNRHSDPIEALCEIESRAREALNPASSPPRMPEGEGHGAAWVAGLKGRKPNGREAARLREALERVERALAPVRGGPIALTRVKLIVHDALHPRALG